MKKQIKFGWVIPSQAPTVSSGAAFVDQVISCLDELENGFDSIWVPDHFHPPIADSNKKTPVLECMTTISFLAASYARFDFGSIVLGQSYRNPGMLAKMGATLQLLTKGRFILGIGAGWKEDEYSAYDYPFPKASVRIEQLAETIQIIQALWSKTPASFVGQHYQIREAYCEPKPNPPPPIMIGGGGEKRTLRVVAEYADWWNWAFGDKEVCAKKMSVLRAHCDDVGRDFQEIVKTWWHYIAIAETESKANLLAEERYASIVGTPEQVVEQLQAFIELGIEYFMFEFVDFSSMTGSNLFEKEVIPKLR
jgi:F420-dependent oxidoreductase-like protein